MAIKDLIEKRRTCPHSEREVRIWGRKRKYRAVICKNCKKLLEIKEIKKTERHHRLPDGKLVRVKGG